MTSLDQVLNRAESDARTYGYQLNPDPDFLRDLLEGLRSNEERYGYPSCPCRLGSGKLEFDRDIICPCDYRDPDVKDFGYCYCGLYVRQDVFEGKLPVTPIPERRPVEKQARAYTATPQLTAEKKAGEAAAVPIEPAKIEAKLWYCRQCGYVCFREDPPYICPICKAKREMFAEIALNTTIEG